MRNWFIFGDLDSRDYGVYINGQGTFGAGERDYNFIPVPGRDGDLLGIESRLKNVDVTFPAYIYRDFPANVARFRAALLSQKGYQRLITSYHPEEYRMATFVGPFEPDVNSTNSAGQFEIVFTCKPQRYLISGETPITMDPTSYPQLPFSGEIATFETDGEYPVSSLKVSIDPVQDLHGYDAPWPPGGGKNKLQVTTSTQTINGVTFTVNDDGTILVNGTASGRNAAFRLINDEQEQALVDMDAEFILSGCPSGGSVTGYRLQWYLYETGKSATDTGSGSISFKPVHTAGNISIVVTNGVSCNNLVFKPMIRLSSVTDATFAPYSNECPISGWTEVKAWVKPVYDPTANPTITIQLGDTVYGGTFDVTTGKMTVTKVETDAGALTWTRYDGSSGYAFYANLPLLSQGVAGSAPDFLMSNYKAVTTVTRSTFISQGANGTACHVHDGRTIYVKDSNYTDAASFKAAMAGQQIVYTLEAPIEIQLDLVQIATLEGINNVWADAGPVEGAVQLPFTIANPTEFDARPLIRIYGTGALQIGDQSITVTQADEYTDIDCEMMDCFKGTVSKNAFVRFSGNDFPVIPPGVSGISIGAGISKITITPRWWTV